MYSQTYGDNDNNWYCKVYVGRREAWGKCNDGCLDDDGTGKKESVKSTSYLQIFTHLHHLLGTCEYEYLEDSGDE